MKRTHWFIGLLGLTAAVIVLLQGQTWLLPVHAQSPKLASPATPASPQPSPLIAPVPTPKLPLAAKGYQDPGKRFQVGLLEGYASKPLAGLPLFESADGQVAYTVAVRPRAVNAALNEVALSQLAIDTFRDGEGLQIGAFEPAPSGGAALPWSGSLTIGRNTQPMKGIILARQVPGRVLLLLIAATESSADQVQLAYNALEPTLKAGESSPTSPS